MGVLALRAVKLRESAKPNLGHCPRNHSIRAKHCQHYSLGFISKRIDLSQAGSKRDLLVVDAFQDPCSPVQRAGTVST